MTGFRWLFTGIVLTILVGAGAGYVALKTGAISANADAKPGAIEKWMARTALHATMDREAPKTPNAVALNDQNLVAGAQLYKEHCAICHGTMDGAPSPIARGENPPPPQLAKEGVEDDPEGISFWKIKHGIRWTGMPAWETTLSDQQIWTLALFLKHMDKLPAAALEALQKSNG